MDEARGKAALERITSHGGRADFFATDVTQGDQVARLVEHTLIGTALPSQMVVHHMLEEGEAALLSTSPPRPVWWVSRAMPPTAHPKGPLSL